MKNSVAAGHVTEMFPLVLWNPLSENYLCTSP
jgi:hypothetical protein